MAEAIKRNLALVVGMILCGAICLQALPWLMSPRGAPGPLVLQAQSPALATLAVVVCVLLASVVAGGAGRFSSAAAGLFVLGIGLYVLDGRLHTIAEPALGATGVGVGAGEAQNGGRAVLIGIAMETLLWAGVSLLGVWIVFKIAGPLRDIEPDDAGRRPSPWTSAEAMRSAACGLLVLPAVWVIAQSPMKGQMIAATFLGSMLAGLAGRLLSPHVQPLLLFVSPMIFGAAAQLATAITLKQPLDVAYVTQSLWKFALVMPLDYAAGSLAGVAFGLGWARSFLHHEEPATATA
jgi:hypothetical protein